MSKEQLSEISNLLLEYSSGNYEFQGKVSDDVNELDMIISGINMLGEELQYTSVSKDYFSSIFNAVTDLVLVLNENGRIADLNQASLDALGLGFASPSDIHIDDIILSDNIFEDVKKELLEGKVSVEFEKKLKGASDKAIHGQFTCSKIHDRFDKFLGYLVSIKDITQQKENEKLILKTIFTTQQLEKRRVADDLHDSLGQELSMTKLLISNIQQNGIDETKRKELLTEGLELLDDAIKHLREICYDLMPSVLIRGGLSNAVEDLLRRLNNYDGLQVHFEGDEEIGRMDPDLEIVMYRIAQEFVNNMIKHAEASDLNVRIKGENDHVSMYMSDNGKGFDMTKLTEIGDSRGYQNLQSKVKAFNGELEMKSEVGKGTTTFVKFPKLKYEKEYDQNSVG